MVEVYSSPTCSNCMILKHQLATQGIEFIEKSIKEKEFLAELRKAGVLSLPAVKFNGEIIKSNDPTMIMATIGGR